MITLETAIILIFIGLAGGFLGGMMGIGGAIIMIPAMVFFLNMSQHSAQGTSLAVMLPPIGFLAVYNYAKTGDVIVLAGKGHETYQEIKGNKYPLDDRELISEIKVNIAL